MFIFIDCCTRNFYFGINLENEWIYKIVIPTQNNLTDLAVEEIFKGIEISRKRATDIERIYVVNGPGSFTGIRVCAVICKTLSLLNEKAEIYSISSLRLSSCSENDCVALIDARSSMNYLLKKVNGKIELENVLSPYEAKFEEIKVISDYNGIDIFSNVLTAISKSLFKKTNPIEYESIYIKPAF